MSSLLELCLMLDYVCHCLSMKNELVYTDLVLSYLGTLLTFLFTMKMKTFDFWGVFFLMWIV